ncbi:hypothetical protein GGF46_000011 [Coemansia sp. RSA 552]|nr:hypothetical protein GGF46_000011 [Coemansia sp. RSA 552]
MTTSTPECKAERDLGDAAQGEVGTKRKLSVGSGDIDLSLLGTPRPGRPSRQQAQDPAMQEARKRARVLRNRAAAQLSREKKRQHLEGLEQENVELREKNAELERRLNKTEDANKDLAARLDGLSQQLQSIQGLLLGVPKQSPPEASLATTPGLDWSAVTPLVASPLHTVQGSMGPPSFPSLAASAPSIPITVPTPTPSLASMADSLALSTTASLEPAAAVETLSSTVSTARPDTSGKGLSESAALEQSGGHIRATSDSQQRMPLSYTESICRKPRQSLAAAAVEQSRKAASLASSCTNWGQQMVQVAVAAVVSASPTSSPQTLWAIFCALWWILSQSGRRLSKHQLSRIARGVLESSPQRLPPSADDAASDFDQTPAGLQSKFLLRNSRRDSRSSAAGLASLGIIAAWLSPGSRTAAALRRVVGTEPVDQVHAFVAGLRVAARSATARRQRVRTAGTPKFYT